MLGLFKKNRGLTALIVIGTRPEAIKLAPVYQEFQRRADRIRTVCLVTGQHRDLIDPLLDFFQIRPDHDLDVFEPDQEPAPVAARVMDRLAPVLKSESPDIVLVQGDTTSAFAAAATAFYAKIPVGHIEAGLRSYDRFRPFPEEVNRACISRIADLHFCPTPRAVENLLAERVPASRIHMTGNTGIDALLATRDSLAERERQSHSAAGHSSPAQRMVLVTAHRRESFGAGLESLALALLDISERHRDVRIVASLHPNPNARGPAQRLLNGRERIELIEPQNYMEFVGLMMKSFLIITDSGGIQEEAPSLDKPILVAREVTERPEALECGAALLVGTDRKAIVEQASRLLDDPVFYSSMKNRPNPFGDGRAAQRIADIIERESQTAEGK